MNNANHTIDALALRIAVREVAGRETRGISEDGKSLDLICRPHCSPPSPRRSNRASTNSLRLLTAAFGTSVMRQ